jgi:hypothetical protein
MDSGKFRKEFAWIDKFICLPEYFVVPVTAFHFFIMPDVIKLRVLADFSHKSPQHFSCKMGRIPVYSTHY